MTAKVQFSPGPYTGVAGSSTSTSGGLGPYDVHGPSGSLNGFRNTGGDGIAEVFEGQPNDVVG